MTKFYGRQYPGILPGDKKEERELGVRRVPIGGKVTRENAKQNAFEKPRDFISATPLAFTATTNLLAILPTNPRRVYLLIQNQGGVNFRVSFGSPGAGVLITPGNSYELAYKCPNSSLYIWTDSGTCNGVLIEAVE